MLVLYIKRNSQVNYFAKQVHKEGRNFDKQVLFLSQIGAFNAAALINYKASKNTGMLCRILDRSYS